MADALTVIKWTEAVKAAGLAETDDQVAALVGLGRSRLAQMKREGTRQLQTDLAMAAVLAGLQPYGS